MESQVRYTAFSLLLLPTTCAGSGLRTPDVIGADVLGYAALDHGVGQHFHHVSAVQPAAGTDRHALPRELIDQIQHANRPSIVGKGADRIVGPDVIGPLRP
jgi:hypothetical protein